MSDSTENPGLEQARETLRAYDARDRSQDEENGATCVICYASIYLNDDCDWPDDGPHCATCENDERMAFVDATRAALAEVERLTGARLEGVKAGLAAAGRAARLAELAQRRNGAVDTYAVGSRECALIIDEIDPAEVSDE